MHVAIIMDGNGRWGEERGMSRSAGHREGAHAVRRVVEAAPALDVGILTLYAFSHDNWKRPRPEVDTLMRLFARFLEVEVTRCIEAGVRLEIIGSRERLTAALLARIEAAERATATGGRLRLRIAIDYSARQSIAAAARRVGASASLDDLRHAMLEAVHSDPTTPDVDLLIRSGRERRISDFLLWESAYAELWFSDVLWPDFGGEDLALAVDDFRRRSRRFGRVSGIDEERAACSMSL